MNINYKPYIFFSEFQKYTYLYRHFHLLFIPFIKSKNKTKNFTVIY